MLSSYLALINKKLFVGASDWIEIYLGNLRNISAQTLLRNYLYVYFIFQLVMTFLGHSTPLLAIFFLLYFYHDAQTQKTC